MFILYAMEIQKYVLMDNSDQTCINMYKAWLGEMIKLRKYSL